MTEVTTATATAGDLPTAPAADLAAGGGDPVAEDAAATEDVNASAARDADARDAANAEAEKIQRQISAGRVPRDYTSYILEPKEDAEDTKDSEKTCRLK